MPVCNLQTATMQSLRDSVTGLELNSEASSHKSPYFPSTDI